MSNIYLKVTFGKDWLSQKFDFPTLKIFSPDQFREAPTHTDIIEF